MPRTKQRRISRPIRKATKAFNLFAHRLASFVAAEVKAALKAAVAAAEEAQAGEVAPVAEARPSRRVRRRHRRVEAVRQAATPQAPRKHGRPRKIVPMAMMKSAVAPVDRASGQVSAGPAPVTKPVDTSLDGTSPVVAGETAQVKEPEPVAAVEPEPIAAPTITRPPDRLTRIRNSFKPGKIAHVADDAAAPAPEEEETSEE